MHKVQKTSRQRFKREAVRLAQTSVKSIAQVACEWVDLMLMVNSIERRRYV